MSQPTSMKQPAQIKLPKPSGQAISRAIFRKTQIVYNLTNVSKHRVYAEDEKVGRFRAFFNSNFASLNTSNGIPSLVVISLLYSTV